MILTLSIVPLLQAQSMRLKAQIAEWDRSLALHHSERYNHIKQQFINVKDWYKQTKSAAQNSGTIPLEQKQSEVSDRLAQAGALAARKEVVIKQQLKDLWNSLRNR